MCLFTHFAAGALAGGATGNVWVGAAAGLASHAVLDMIPHWDHPDWRVELAAGLASLVLLLLMPFATAPAVVGGILGMVPDLENLFQKLGWMGRGRFVFPTHTGLLPHGRALGPRSLGWQVAIFVVCFGALGLITPTDATAAEPGTTAVLGRPEIELLASDEQRTVVRLRLPAAQSPSDWESIDPRLAVWPVAGWTGEQGLEDVPPQWLLPLAVPTRLDVPARVLGVSWWKEPTEGSFDQASLVQAGRPAVQRGVPILGAVVALSGGGGILREITLEFSHAPTGTERENLGLAGGEGFGLKSGAEAPTGVLNPDLQRRLAAGDRERALTGRPAAHKDAAGPLFAATTHWLKLDVTATGFYRVSGQDLAGWGVSTGEVDPAKLRLYRGGGLHLDANPEVPDAAQPRRVGLNEVAISVQDGGDGEWNLDDELHFYGVGTSTWLDRFDPAAGRLDHYDHPAASTAVYWLTWEADAVPSPLPGTPRRVLPVAAPAQGAPVETAGQVRTHFEQQVLDDRGLVADNYVWANTISSSRTESFTLRNPVPGAAARYSVEVRATSFGWRPTYEAVAWLNGDEAGAGRTFFTGNSQEDSLRVRVMGSSATVVAGGNTLRLRNARADSGQVLALDSYGVMVPSRLDLGDGQGPIQFGLWGDTVPAPGTPTDLQVAVPAPSELLLWDVTVPDSSLALAGTAGTGTVTYGLVRDPGVDRHFVTARRSSLARVAAGRRVQPVDLTARSTALDYVVIAPQGFINAAADLAAYRGTDIPGIAVPAAAAVLVDDIYDNFSGGQKDVWALRNYLRWVYGQSAHRLQYVCLLGNASRDPRNYKNKVPYLDLADLVPTQLRTTFPDNPAHESVWDSPYASDDGLVSFEASQYRQWDTPDLHCARLPALTPAEARGMVDRVIAYARSPEPGPWRNHVLMTADDANRPGHPVPIRGIEPSHTVQAEKLAETYLPVAVDVQKIFAVDYPFAPGSRIKPEVRQAINVALSAGTTMFYYVGHGADDNLADEQIFRTQDIAGLTNGLRRFVFLAFSCDVGVYDSIVRRSMAEEFVAGQAGGAIAAICASQVSFVNENEDLSEAFYAVLYPGRGVMPERTLGAALSLAKGLMGGGNLGANAQRYTLFGDPATRLPHPDDSLGFATGSLDTLRTGRRHTALVDDGAGDGYSLLVNDSQQPTVFTAWLTYYDSSLGRNVYVSPADYPWLKQGATVFRGTGTAGAGDLAVPFKAPLQLGLGERGRVRLIVDDPDGGRTAVATVPVVSGGTGPSDDLIGPDIVLGFEDGRYRVQPGTQLEVALQDTSGIAMLGTSPGNSILLEFDDSGFMTNVTGAFAYDPDSYTAGRLGFGLPSDLAPGRHTAALYAADALGNVGSDTLSFELVPAGVADIASVTLFPNPTAGPCRLIFELSEPMEVRWDIYTVAGRRVRTVQEAFAQAGPRILEWDGRDTEGDEIGNGTYLYVVRGLSAGGDGRDITRTGKLVIMR